MKGYKVQEVLEKMKWFIKGYHKNFYIDWGIVSYFENMLQRKVFGKKLKAKLEKVFELIFQIKKIRQLQMFSK
jgi:hypothetical protein